MFGCSFCASCYSADLVHSRRESSSATAIHCSRRRVWHLYGTRKIGGKEKLRSGFCTAVHKLINDGVRAKLMRHAARRGFCHEPKQRGLAPLHARRILLHRRVSTQIFGFHDV